MNPELERLLKAWDQFIQTPKGPEADHVYTLYQARLNEIAERSNLSSDVLHLAVKRCHERWVRANLPAGFPKRLGLQ